MSQCFSQSESREGNIRSFSQSTSAAASEDQVNESEMSSENEKFDFAVDYKLFVKIANGDNNIMPSEFSVTFKMQRKTGTNIQLVDEQDFIKFKSEYTKLATRKSDIKIYITIVRQSTKNK
ncbi:6002_t:CDS:2 [Dentiscutata erythropus]|uniref:6002_t:CDS:1 n=1 Tax=Dentiscutata erythropus TaxID=1348616 RepID=A0A9N8Z723_9GLOM|nr:6002_t:CDS:2 [Dentiscutata erythropus]